ncbi:MAG: transposase domain-containing protein [Saprospiraceae bacterium]|nr:transposase domain-containing protein [Saprospiraceae bacterium]
MFATCKLHDINPYEWLTDFFHRIKDHPINRISELLPQNWCRSTTKKNIEIVT